MMFSGASIALFVLPVPLCCRKSTTVWPLRAAASGMTKWCFKANLPILTIPAEPCKVFEKVKVCHDTPLHLNEDLT